MFYLLHYLIFRKKKLRDNNCAAEKEVRQLIDNNVDKRLRLELILRKYTLDSARSFLIEIADNAKIIEGKARFLIQTIFVIWIGIAYYLLHIVVEQKGFSLLHWFVFGVDIYYFLLLVASTLIFLIPSNVFKSIYSQPTQLLVSSKAILEDKNFEDSEIGRLQLSITYNGNINKELAKNLRCIFIEFVAMVLLFVVVFIVNYA